MPFVSPWPSRYWSLSQPLRRLAAPQEPPPSAASMKAYTETIPGTDIKFDMVPIPGGTFEMGAPAGEAKHGKDEEPPHTVQIEPFWMGAKEVTWDEYEQFAFSYDLKKKKRDGVDLRSNPTWRRKPTPSPGPRRPTPTRRSATAEAGSRPSASPTTRPWNIAAGSRRRPASSIGFPPRPNGNTPAAPAPRPRISGATASIRSTNTPGSSTTPRSRCRSARRSQARGDFTISTATSTSGAWTITKPMPTSKFAAAKPCKGPVVLPDAKEYPYVARGGSWDDDAELLRSAARRARTPSGACKTRSAPRASGGTPTPLASASASSGRSAEQDNLKGLKSQVVKGKTTR